MQTTVEKLILLPRYTTFAGATTFETPPLNVRRYGSALIDLTIAGALGSPAADATVVVQESPDLGIWRDVVTLVDGVATEADFTFEWIRLTITVSGTDPAVSLWCVGNFIGRDVA